MLLTKIKPDGSLTVVNVKETHCLKLWSDTLSKAKGKEIQEVKTVHYTADGIRGVVRYEDGIDYEIVIKPILPKGE